MSDLRLICLGLALVVGCEEPAPVAPTQYCFPVQINLAEESGKPLGGAIVKVGGKPLEQVTTPAGRLHWVMPGLANSTVQIEVETSQKYRCDGAGEIKLELNQLPGASAPAPVPSLVSIECEDRTRSVLLNVILTCEKPELCAGRSVRVGSEVVGATDPSGRFRGTWRILSGDVLEVSVTAKAGTRFTQNPAASFVPTADGEVLVYRRRVVVGDEPPRVEAPKVVPPPEVIEEEILKAPEIEIPIAERVKKSAGRLSGTPEVGLRGGGTRVERVERVAVRVAALDEPIDDPPAAEIIKIEPTVNQRAEARRLIEAEAEEARRWGGVEAAEEEEEDPIEEVLIAGQPEETLSVEEIDARQLPKAVKSKVMAYAPCARSASRRGLSSECVRTFEAVSRKDTHYRASRESLINYYQKKKKWRKVISKLDEVAKAEPSLKNDPSWHLARGDAWGRRGQFRRSVKSYGSALKFQLQWPANRRGKNTLRAVWGQAYAYEQLSRKSPRDSDLYDKAERLGRKAERIAREQGSRSTISRATKLLDRLRKRRR